MISFVPFLKLLLRIEFRNKSKLFSLFFYSIVISFLFGLFFKNISPPIWNINFWILFLFNALNISYNLFNSVSLKELRFLKNSVSPYAYLLGMFLALFVLILFNNLLMLGVFALFGGIAGISMNFAGTVVLLAFAISSNLALISFIGQKAGANTGLLTVLSLPTTIPLLAKAIVYGQMLLQNQGASDTSHIIFILSIGMFLLVLSFFLFPLLWKD